MKLRIPEGLDFGALNLHREANRDLSFDVAAVNQICAHNNISPEVFWQTQEDNVAGLIIAWYQAHRESGGAPDAVAEQLILETAIDIDTEKRSEQN